MDACIFTAAGKVPLMFCGQGPMTLADFAVGAAIVAVVMLGAWLVIRKLLP